MSQLQVVPGTAPVEPGPTGPAAAATPGPRERLRFGERLRLMRNKRNEDWWSIVFGGPIAALFAAVVADVRWVTPNRITWLAFAVKLAVVPLVLTGGFAADLAAIVLMQVNAVLDCMDGSLARYRRRPSVMGAFLDKITDAIGLLAICAAIGYRVFTETGDVVALLLILLAAVSYVTRAYVYWVVAYLEQGHQVAAPSTAAAGKKPGKKPGEMRFGERLIYYLRATPRIFYCGEADIYFWLGLGLALGRLREISYGLGAVLGIWFVMILIHRYRAVAALDRRVRAAGGAP